MLEMADQVGDIQSCGSGVIKCPWLNASEIGDRVSSLPGKDEVWVAVPSLLSGTKHSHTSMYKRNYNAFIERFDGADGVVTISGRYDAFGIALTIQALKNTEILEFLDALQYQGEDEDEGEDDTNFYAGNPLTITELAIAQPHLFRKRKPKVSKAKSKSTSKRIAVGSKVLFCGQEALVTGKHENKGWWTVEIIRDGKTVTTSGDRSLITLI